MPRKRKSDTPTAEMLAPVPVEVLDQFVREGPLTAAEVEAATRRFKKAIIERAFGCGAESSPRRRARRGQTGRHGQSSERQQRQDGADRRWPAADHRPTRPGGTFEPQWIGQHERRFTGLDDKVLALYARGLSVREIQAFLQEMYGVEVSPDLISTVTDAVVAEVTAWQARPLEPLYPVVFFDAVRVKIRDDGVVRSQAVYLAPGVLADGTRDSGCGSSRPKAPNSG